MKTKEENKQSGANPKASADKQGEKLFSLMASYPSASPSIINVPGNNGQLAGLESPEYDSEGEEVAQEQHGGITTGEDTGAGDDGQGNPNSGGAGGADGAEDSEDGSIKLGTGNYAKGRATKEEKKATQLGEKSKTVDEKNKQDVESQETGIIEGQENAEQKGNEKEAEVQKEAQKITQDQDGKAAKLQGEKQKVDKQGGEKLPSSNAPVPVPAPAMTAGNTQPKGSNQKAKPQKKGQNFVVGKESVPLFSGSQIIKTTSQGNSVVYAENGLKGDQEEAAQPLPQHIIQQEVDKRKQANNASAQVFESQSQSQIIQVKTAGDQQQTQLNLSQTMAIGEIDIATSQALENVDSELSAAKEEITSQFDSFAQELQAHSQTVIESINAKTIEEQANVDTTLATAIEASVQLQETTISSAENSVDTQVQRIKDEATRMGELAVQIANAQADVERGKEVKEQSRWENIKNGGDYEENKKKARVDACVQVGKQTKKQFLETAENAAAELLSSKASIREEITANVTQLTDAFTNQAEDTKSAIESSAEGHIQQITSQTETLVQDLEAKKSSEIAALDSFASTKKAEISQISAQLKSQLQEQTSSAKQQLDETVNSSIDQLTSSKSELMGQLNDAAEIPIEEFQTLQSNIAQNFQKAAQDVRNSVNDAGSSSNESIVSFGSQAVEQIGQAASASVEGIANQKSQAITTGEGMKSSGMSSLDSLKTEAESQLAQITESLNNFFNEKISEFTNSFNEASQKIDEDLKSNADEVIAGFQTEIDNLPATLTTKANEAEAAVKPRWRKVLSVIIEIVAAVALAAVVALLVASGVGIIGLLIGGAIAGALIGAGKQMLNNAIDGKPLSEGVGKAMAVGAVEGVFAALTGGAGSQIMSKVGGKLTSMGASTFVNGASKFGQRAVGKFAVQALSTISEGAAKQIVSNIADGKSWNEGLLRTVTTGAIDSVIGFGTGKLTSRIQGSNALGSQVGESLTRRAGREVTEFGVDYAGGTISSGAQNVVNNWDKIQSGEAGMLDTFGEGVQNDWETNLIKSGTRNAKGFATNQVNDRMANRRYNQGRGGGDFVPKGYTRTMTGFGEDASVGLRPTTTFNANGRRHADLDYDSSGNIVRKGAQQDNRGTDEVVAGIDPSRSLSADERGMLANWARQGKQDRIDEFTAQNSDRLEASRRNFNDNNSDAIEGQGLPSQIDGYTYVSGEDGGVSLARNRNQNEDGKDLPRLGVEGGKIVRSDVEVETRSRQEYLQDIDPSQRLPKNVRGELYNHARQGNQEQVDAILKQYDNDLVRSRRMGNNTSESASVAASRGLPEAPEGYHYSQSGNGTLYIKRTRVNDNEGNERPELTVDGGRLRYVDQSQEGNHPQIDRQMGYKPFMSDSEILRDPKGSRRDPATYLVESYMMNHMKKFQQEGASFIAVRSWTEGGNPKYRSLPSRKFVGLRSEMDQVISEYRSSGDWRVLRDKLNLGATTDLSSDEIYYIKIDPNDPRFSFEMPSGNEGGAIDGEWKPGGFTGNGIQEAGLEGSQNVIHNKDINVLVDQFNGNAEQIK